MAAGDDEEETHRSRGSPDFMLLKDEEKQQGNSSEQIIIKRQLKSTQLPGSDLFEKVNIEKGIFGSNCPRKGNDLIVNCECL